MAYNVEGKAILTNVSYVILGVDININYLLLPLVARILHAYSRARYLSDSPFPYNTLLQVHSTPQDWMPTHLTLVLEMRLVAKCPTGKQPPNPFNGREPPKAGAVQAPLRGLVIRAVLLAR